MMKADITGIVEHALKEEFEKQANILMQKAIDNTKIELERRLAEIVAKVSIALMQQVDMETLGDKLLISVHMGKN
jgi:hypothetical protein